MDTDDADAPPATTTAGATVGVAAATPITPTTTAAGATGTAVTATTTPQKPAATINPAADEVKKENPSA